MWKSIRIRNGMLAVLFFGILLAAAGLLTSTLSIVLLGFAGVLFGIFLNGLARMLGRFSKLDYGWNYPIVVVLLIGIAAGGFYYMGASIAEQVAQLSSLSGKGIEQARSQVSQLPGGEQLLSSLQEVGKKLGSQFMVAVRWLSWGGTGLFVIFFVGLYLAYDPDLYRTGVVKLIPPEQRDRAEEVLDVLRQTLAKWITGRIISMAIIGVCTAIGLAVLGVPLPVTLGVLSALLTFIPNIGPLIAALPQVLLALNVGSDTAVQVLGFNAVLQMLESYLVTPIVQRWEVSAPPALIILAQLLMSVWAGIIGMAVAAPLVVTVMVLTQMLYIRDILGDSHPGQLVEDATG